MYSMIVSLASFEVSFFCLLRLASFDFRLWNLSGTLFLSHDGRDISSLANHKYHVRRNAEHRTNCLGVRIKELFVYIRYWIFYISKTADAACEESPESTQEGLQVDPHGSEGYLKMVVEVPDSSWLTRSIATCSYPTDKHKDIMKAQYMFPRLPLSEIPHNLSQSVEVLKLKNFKKDATLKLSKSTNQESSRKKLNPEVNDHYNIFSRESQEYELKTKDEA
ncbi:hypothetical protein Tco_0356151 [Tanacetum coccineum]